MSVPLLRAFPSGVNGLVLGYRDPVTDAADATKGSVTINVDDCMDSTPAKHDLSIVELSVCDPATGAVKKVKVLASAPY